MCEHCMYCRWRDVYEWLVWRHRPYSTQNYIKSNYSMQLFIDGDFRDLWMSRGKGKRQLCPANHMLTLQMERCVWMASLEEQTLFDTTFYKSLNIAEHCQSLAVKISAKRQCLAYSCTKVLGEMYMYTVQLRLCVTRYNDKTLWKQTMLTFDTCTVLVDWDVCMDGWVELHVHVHVVCWQRHH